MATQVAPDLADKARKTRALERKKAARMMADKLVARIEAKRESLGITPYQLGQLLNWSPSGLLRVLNRKVKPRLETVILIADALGIKFRIKIG